MVKLPVFDVLGKAFTAPFKFTWPLLPFYIVAAVIALSLFGLAFASGIIPNLETGDTAAMTWQGGISVFALILAAYLVFILVAVLTHRVAADADHQWQLAMPVIRYFLIALVLGLIGVVFYLAGLAVIFAVVGAEMALDAENASFDPMTGFVLLAFVVLGIAIGARLFLALPAAALERKRPISLSWRISHGNTFRLLGAWVLYFILMLAINVAAFLIVGGTEALMQSPDIAADNGDAALGWLGAFGAGWLIINVIVNYYVTVAGAAFLTYSFIALSPNSEQEARVANAASQH
ncbi:MAG: hypothetical protein ACFB0Z_11685 [Candidatus Phaeomarinobacter sp.]